MLTPTGSSAANGVSDFAFRLGNAASQTLGWNVRFGVASRRAEPAKNVGALFHELSKVKGAVPAVDIMLHYTPRSYSLFGYPIRLLHALNRLSIKPSRIFVLFHETWGKEGKLHHRIVHAGSRQAARELASFAHGLASVTSGQAEQISILSGRQVINFPVSSSVVPVSRDSGLTTTREAGTWALFGLAHTRRWALEKTLPMLVQCRRRGLLKRIILIGPACASERRRERDLLIEFADHQVEQCGELSFPAVSARLLNASAGLTGQNEDSLTKSSSFMAYAAHGLPVMTDSTLTSIPGKWTLSLAELLHTSQEIVCNVIETRRQALHKWFWETRSWPAMAEIMQEWLDKKS